MWGIENDMARLLIEVDHVVFGADGYWLISAHSLPERPMALSGLPREPRPLVAQADDFWKAVTPVGGTLAELSKTVSRDQYYGPQTKERRQ